MWQETLLMEFIIPLLINQILEPYFSSPLFYLVILEPMSPQVLRTAYNWSLDIWCRSAFYNTSLRHSLHTFGAISSWFSGISHMGCLIFEFIERIRCHTFLQKYDVLLTKTALKHDKDDIDICKKHSRRRVTSLQSIDSNNTLVVPSTW